MQDVQSRRQRFFYSFGRIGGGLYDGFNNAILPLYLHAFTGNPFIIGYLSNSRSMEGVIIQPLVGRWSDRTHSRLGRRRPFILAGAPISVFFLLMVPLLGHAHNGLALPLVAAAIILFSLTFNVAGDPYDALMIDITPPRRRPVYNAILNVISLLGYVGVTLYASQAALKKDTIPDTVFYVTALALLVGYGVVVLFVREPKSALETARREEKIPLRTYVQNLRAFTEAFKFLMAIFFFWNGILALLPFLPIFMTDTIGVTKSQSLIVMATLTLSGAVCAYPFGWLGARFGNRPLIVVGSCILIISALLGFAVRSYAMLFPLAVLAGAGYAAANALLYPFLAELVPESKIGVFTGLKTAFAALATPISVLVTGVLINLFSYRSIFGVLAVMMAVCVGFLLSINELAARNQVELVDGEETKAIVA